jgi:oligoendopeptidase F
LTQQIPSPLPRWDLSNVYPGLDSEQFTKAFAELNERIDALDAYMATHRVSRIAGDKPDGTTLKTAIDGYLTLTNAALRLFSTLHAFVGSYVSTDSYNTAAKRLQSELEVVGVRLQKQEVLFKGWVGSIGSLLPDILVKDGVAKAHSFYLRETLEQSRFLMSDQEESLAAELELSGSNAWAKLHGTICSQVTVDFELDGKKQKLPITELQNLNTHPDREIRRRAYDAELAAWESVREPLAAALNAVKGAVNTLDKRRGRSDALHASLDTSRINRETLNALTGAMKESFPVFRRYLLAKAKLLGQKRLPWWDLFAPVGKSERRYTWRETQEFLVTQFRTFSDRLAMLAQRAFANHWIDAEPRRGKRGGAFCMEVAGVEESRILCNFDGSLDQVSTVAHELGHAFHNECQVGKTMLQKTTPMTLAETASIMNETIIANAALSKATSRDEELAILETSLAGATQVIVDITSRFLFEKEVFERRLNSELSADDFCEIMLRSQKATYGEALDERFLNKYMWAWKGHYYIPSFSFYNYPYAFGLLFGTGLYSIYRERGHPFVKDYESLLASTGEATPMELAGRFGIDLQKPDFWRSSLKLLEGNIERYERL